MCVSYIQVFPWLSVVDSLLTVAVISRGSLIIADIIVIVVTWVTTYKIATLSRSVLNHNQPTFSGLLLRDGTLYFT